MANDLNHLAERPNLPSGYGNLRGDLGAPNRKAPVPEMSGTAATAAPGGPPGSQTQ